MSPGRTESLRASVILGYYLVSRDLNAKTPWLFPPALRSPPPAPMRRVDVDLGRMLVAGFGSSGLSGLSLRHTRRAGRSALEVLETSANGREALS